MGYERYARVEIDLDCVAHNVRVLKGLVPRRTAFMAVVKADAYGHGAVPVARTALGAGADRLGVATIEEAAELRDAGITGTIQLLSEPPVSAVPAILDLDLVSTVTTREFAVELGKRAAALDREARYHLKIDTGMNRIGVRAEDAAEFARGLKDFPGLRLEGVFTHFATAETPGDWDFESQLQRFEAARAQIRTEGIDPGMVGAANSAATILHPESHYDMVRCGIAIYGLHPWRSTYDKVDLRPAMSVKAQVSFVKRIGMGEGVSYGLTWRASAPSTIATLPLGYADGVHRLASNRMSVLCGGVRCDQVGRVCMDQIMFEVPRGVQVRPGDEVVLIGSMGDARITMDELAEAAETINYETACAFGMRLPRRYV